MTKIVRTWERPSDSGTMIRAVSHTNSVTVPWDDALGVDDNHRAAAQACAGVPIGGTDLVRSWELPGPSSGVQKIHLFDGAVVELRAALAECAGLLRGEDIDPDGQRADEFKAIAERPL